jgi:hypothetical protein
VKFPLPIRGVDENWGFETQEQGTARDGRNIRSQDNENRRLRIVKRAGFKFFPADPTPQVNGSNKVQDLCSITQAQKPIDYTPVTGSGGTPADPSSAPTIWELNPDDQSAAHGNNERRVVYRLRVDQQGNVFALWGDSEEVNNRRYVNIYSASGKLIQTLVMPVAKDESSSPLLSEEVHDIALDNAGGLYAGGSLSVTNAGCTLVKFRKVPDYDTEVGWKYQLDWTLAVPADTTSMSEKAGDVRAIEYVPELDFLYVLQQSNEALLAPAFLTVIGNPTSTTPDIRVRFELLDTAGAAIDNIGASSTRHPTGLAVRRDGKFWVSMSAGILSSQAPLTLLYPEPTVPNETANLPGNIVSGASDHSLVAQASYTHQDTGAGAESGGGSAVILCNDGLNAFICGVIRENLLDTHKNWFLCEVREPVGGATALELEEYAEIAIVNGDLGNTVEQCQMAVDQRENVYWPAPLEPSTAGARTNAFGFRVYHRYPTDFGNGSGTSFLELLDYNTNATVTDCQGTRCIAVRPEPLETQYEGDLSVDVDACIAGTAATACSRAEYVYLGMVPEKWNSGVRDQPTLRKLQIVTNDNRTGDARRNVRYLAVANNDLRINDGVSATWDVPTGDDEDPLDSATGTASRYIESTPLFTKRYYTDGRNYGVYDPFDDSWKKLVADRGELPEACQLISYYSTRLVLARSSKQGPHAWFMSAAENPLDWDEAPAIETRDQAISGTNLGGPLQVGDIINSLAPIGDDLLIFGCDRSIWVLRGDPLASNALLDNVTDEVGMAFGRPYTRDRSGFLWFIDSEGGLCVMRGLQPPERISENRLEARLRNVDQSTHYYRLRWDNEQEGIHIFVCPFGAATTTTEHWFFQPRTFAFWPMKTSLSGVTAVGTFDSDDPDDRRVAVGFNDGRVRLFDSGSEDDDGTAIDAFVDIPLLPPQAEQRWRFKNLRVSMARDRGECNFEVYGLRDPDESPSIVAASGRLLPGRNRFVAAVEGSFPILRLRDASLRSFAVESISYEYALPVGRSRR